MSKATLATPCSQYACPSAQPDMPEARAIGLISGGPEAPRVAYLKADAVIDAASLPHLDGLQAAEVFRLAARCEEGRCAQYGDGRCTLARRLVDGLDPVVSRLPSCTIRDTCRWFAEQGRAACVRCPQVVTFIPRGTDRLSRVAALPTGASR